MDLTRDIHDKIVASTIENNKRPKYLILNSWTFEVLRLEFEKFFGVLKEEDKHEFMGLTIAVIPHSKEKVYRASVA